MYIVSKIRNKDGLVYQPGSSNKSRTLRTVFTRRCLTIWVEDLLKWDWPQKVHAAGMNTIATHFTVPVWKDTGTENGNRKNKHISTR